MAYTSQNEYLQELEALLKKNRGARVNTLYDTASNIPDQLITADPLARKRVELPLEPDDIGQLEMTLPQIAPRQPAQIAPQGNAQESTRQFLEQLGQVYYSPEVQKSIQRGQFQNTDQEGGYLGADNTYYYDDGTSRTPNDASAFPIRSNADGSTQYSDGSVRGKTQQGDAMRSVMSREQYMQLRGKGNIQQGQQGKPINSFDDYLQILSQGKLSGENITGGYGEYYGLPREAYNIGTDIGTGRLGNDQAGLYLPFNAKVVSVSKWDNQDAYSTSTPYGNSVLVQLPTGHMIRFSHLSELGNLQEGQEIGAGTYLGTTGDTGHAFGKHLDHEIYMPDGTLSSSESFFDTLKNQPELAQKLSVPGSEPQKQESQPYPFFSQEGNPPTNITQPQQEAPKQESNVFSNIQNTIGKGISAPVDYIEKTKPTGDYGIGLTELAKGDVMGAKNELASSINKINPTGDFDLGLTEGLQGKPNLAQEKRRQTAENVGQGIAGLGQSVGLPEFNVSEFISQIPDMFGGQVYASEVGQQTPKKEDNIFQKSLAQAGQGVSNLKNELGNFVEDNIFKKKALSSMGMKNAIGEDTGGSVAANLGDMRSMPQDNRNAFFKAGGLDTYKDYLAPNVTSGYRGALNMSLFNDKFYENPDNVANVFGSTSLAKDATGKYKNYMSSQYPILPGGESPTVKKTARGRYDDGEEWSVEYDDVNPIYYDNEYNRSVLASIPETLSSQFKFATPKTGKTSYAGSSSPQGLYEPVQGDMSSKEDYSKAKSSPILPVSNVFKPQGVAQNMPQASSIPIPKQQVKVARPSTPAPAPVPTPQPQQSRPSSSQVSAPVQQQSRPSSSQSSQSSQQSSQQVRQSTPAPAPKQNYTPAPKPAPKPAPAPTPAPKPASKPAPQQSKPQQQNVFQQLINYLFRR